MMQELIERLEKATGPDRELDAAIFAFCGEPPERLKIHSDLKMWAEGKTVLWSGGTVTQAPVFQDGKTYPHYTASIDAARALLPWKDHPGATFTSKVIQSGFGEFYHFVEFTWPSTEREGRARTEPLATCICALLAIQETERQLAPYRPKAKAAATLTGIIREQ